ncbi:MAG: hypothetical protein OEU26_17545 [Candidatus Tectomicrobia bacterium]|nr:hypothetical protein [Candidatus Tectomicrobia bacterium]
MKKSVCLLLIIPFLLSCASMSDKNRTRAEGTAVGTGAGAGLGALLGYAAGGSKGAVIGAVAGAGIGAGLGYAWGNHVASKKADYASQEDYLDAVAQSARQVNEETRQYNASLAEEIRQLDTETATLVRQYNQKKIARSILEERRVEMEKKLAGAKEHLKVVETEIKIQRKVLDQEKQKVESVQAQNNLVAMETEVAELERVKAELEQQVDTLASIGARVSV